MIINQRVNTNIQSSHSYNTIFSLILFHDSMMIVITAVAGAFDDFYLEPTVSAFQSVPNPFLNCAIWSLFASVNLGVNCGLTLCTFYHPLIAHLKEREGGNCLGTNNERPHRFNFNLMRFSRCSNQIYQTANRPQFVVIDTYCCFGDLDLDKAALLIVVIVIWKPNDGVTV